MKSWDSRISGEARAKREGMAHTGAEASRKVKAGATHRGEGSTDGKC